MWGKVERVGLLLRDVGIVVEAVLAFEQLHRDLPGTQLYPFPSLVRPSLA
jgi:hypothetical protein